MTTRNRIIFRITIVAFLATFFAFIPGCVGKSGGMRRHEALVDEKVAEIEAALALGERDGWAKAFPALDAIHKDLNRGLVDNAFKKMSITREEFEKKYKLALLEGGGFKIMGGEHVAPRLAWQITLLQVEEKKKAELYSDAMSILRKFDKDICDVIEEIGKAYKDTEKDLTNAAVRANAEDKKTVRGFIALKKFNEAKNHIAVMRQRYKKDVFPYLCRQITYLEREWAKAEMIERGKVFVIENNTPTEEFANIVRKIIGKDLRDYGTYCISRHPGANGILIKFKLNSKQTFSLPLRFNLNGPRNIEGHGALQFSIAGPRGTKVRVNMSGGSGTRYEAKRTLGTFQGSTAFSFVRFRAGGGVKNKASDEAAINGLTVTITVRNNSSKKKIVSVFLGNVAFVP